MANRDQNAPPTPRGARSMQRILDAAARLIGDAGFEGATMKAVARAAGVSKGLLHYHFQSKEHLLIEAQRATFRQIHLRFEERFEQGEGGVPTAIDALDALWGSIRDMRDWAPFMVEAWSLAGTTAGVREHLDTFYAEAEELLETGIRRAFGDDVDKLMVPPERLVQMVRTGLHGLTVELALAQGAEDLARIDQTYLDTRQQFELMLERSLHGSGEGKSD